MAWPFSVTAMTRPPQKVSLPTCLWIARAGDRRRFLTGYVQPCRNWSGKSFAGFIALRRRCYKIVFVETAPRRDAIPLRIEPGSDLPDQALGGRIHGTARIALANQGECISGDALAHFHAPLI